MTTIVCVQKVLWIVVANELRKQQNAEKSGDKKMWCVLKKHIESVFFSCCYLFGICFYFTNGAFLDIPLF